MVGAQLDATFKECFGGENGFLHVVFSSLEDLLNDFHCFFSAFQSGQSVYHKPPVACCSFLQLFQTLVLRKQNVFWK